MKSTSCGPNPSMLFPPGNDGAVLSLTAPFRMPGSKLAKFVLERKGAAAAAVSRTKRLTQHPTATTRRTAAACTHAWRDSMDLQTLARRALALATAVGLVAELVLDRHEPGINLLIASTALLASAWVVAGGPPRLDPLDAWLPIAALVFVGFVALRDDGPLVALDTVAAVGLVGASVAAFAGWSVTRSALRRLFHLAGWVLLSALVGAANAVGRARLDALMSDRYGRNLGRMVPVARGIVIASPLLLIFTLLFAAADEVFGTYVGQALAIEIDIGDLPMRIVFVALVAWLVAGLLWLIVDRPSSIEGSPVDRSTFAPQSLGAAARTAAAAWPRLGSTEALTILLGLDLLFGLFVVLQVAYLFGGRDTLAATGMPYAQYARRGFFELVLAVGLSGLVISGLEAFIGDRRRAYVVALLGLIGLTGVVLASSFLRLRLYQDAYGWTELRFYVEAAIAFFAAGLFAAGALVARNASRWLGHALAIAALGVLAGVNVVGPQAFITDRNLERALNPGAVPSFGEERLDAAYLGRFEADAVPGIVAALPRLSVDDRVALIRRLAVVKAMLDRDRGDLVAWNLSRERAREALDSLPAGTLPAVSVKDLPAEELPFPEYHFAP
jgi:Domain of unknown function (DUF4173)